MSNEPIAIKRTKVTHLENGGVQVDKADAPNVWITFHNGDEAYDLMLEKPLHELDEDLILKNVGPKILILVQKLQNTPEADGWVKKTMAKLPLVGHKPGVRGGTSFNRAEPNPNADRFGVVQMPEEDEEALSEEEAFLREHATPTIGLPMGVRRKAGGPE